MSTRDIIKKILVNDKRARTDDNYLYGRVIEHIAMEQGNYNDLTKCFVRIMCGYNLPSVHTVVRERRYIQKAEPELIDKVTEKKRFLSEADFRLKYGKE